MTSALQFLLIFFSNIIIQKLISSINTKFLLDLRKNIRCHLSLAHCDIIIAFHLLGLRPGRILHIMAEKPFSLSFPQVFDVQQIIGKLPVISIVEFYDYRLIFHGSIRWLGITRDLLKFFVTIGYELNISLEIWNLVLGLLEVLDGPVAEVLSWSLIKHEEVKKLWLLPLDYV